MAPKRRGRRVVGTVKKTKKTVEETLEVSFVESGTTNNDDETQKADDTQRAVVDSQETVELIDSLSPPYPTAERIKRTIIVEETKTPEQEVAVDDDVGEPTAEEKRKNTKPPAKEQDMGLKAEGSGAAYTTDDDETQEPEQAVPEKKKVKEGTEKRGDGGEKRLRKRRRKVEEGNAEYKRYVLTQEPEQAVPEKKKVKEGTEKGGDCGGKRLRKRRRKVEEGNAEYKRYVFWVLKQVHPGMMVSSQAMEVLNAYMNDMFERLADEAAKLSRYTKKLTLSSWEIQGAVRLVLPGDLGKHAIAEGAKAVTNYMDYDGNHGVKMKS